MSTRRVLFLLAGAVLASSTGCIHISQRALDNGRAMTSSMQYYDVMSGNVNNASLKRLYYRSSARLMYQRDLPYAPFGHWDR